MKDQQVACQETGIVKKEIMAASSTLTEEAPARFSMRHNQAPSQTNMTVTVHMKSGSRQLQGNKSLVKRQLDEESQKADDRNGGDSGAPKRVKGSCLIIQRQEMTAFFQLLDDDLILDFLWMDCCCKIADKYLLAMTFVYFKRAGFRVHEYTRANFFIALYLANTVEEDNEEDKYEIFPWALGKDWMRLYPGFLKTRDQLWSRIQFRAAVSRRCCDEVMAIAPAHYIWQRERSEQHSGAVRNYNQDDDIMPRGPSATPPDCALCGKKGRLIGVGLSSSSSSSPDTSPSGGQKASRCTPISPEKVNPPQFCSYFQVNQEKKTRRGLRSQDKSMAWFSNSEE